MSQITIVRWLPAALVLILGASGCGRRDAQESRGPAATSSPPATVLPASPPPPRPFSEETRRAIFQEILGAEASADREAMAANPDADSVGTGTNPEKMVRRVQKRSRVSEVLRQRYRGEVAARYSLTEGELAEIVNEGRTKNWPSPPE